MLKINVLYFLYTNIVIVMYLQKREVLFSFAAPQK